MSKVIPMNKAIDVVNGKLTLVTLPEYGDVGCDGFDYAEHYQYGRLSLDPVHARRIRWMDGESYWVPRVISELFQKAIDDESGIGVAGGRTKEGLMMEMIGWRHAKILGS